MNIKPLIWVSGDYNIHRAHTKELPKLVVAVVDWDSMPRDDNKKYRGRVQAFGATMTAHRETLEQAKDWCHVALLSLVNIVLKPEETPK